MADNQYIIDAELEYSKARRRSILASLFSFASGKSDELISLEEAKDLLKPTAESYQGIRTIEISKIVGSEGRYTDFNRRFLPRRSGTRVRWKSIHVAHQKEIGLPAIQVYELGGYYFIRDGNHRVSVAIQRGGSYMEAQVTSLSIKIPLEGIETIADLKRAVLDYEHARFLESLGKLELPPGEDIRFTATGRYDDLAVHIACHRKILEKRSGKTVGHETATLSWHRAVYRPIVQYIRDSKVLRYAPERTESDLYVWLVRNWDTVAVSRGPLVLPNRRLRRRFRSLAG